MKRYWNNKGRITLCLLLFALCSTLLALCLILPNKANSGPYLDSAHANTSYGVNRSSLSTFGYSMGNCAHCHEQHASIGGTEPAPAGGSPTKYELFTGIGQNQGSRFCYACHRDPGLSQQISMPYQYNYSRIAGGDNNTCPAHIRGAFVFILDDCSGSRASICSSSYGSAHCLKDIQNFLANKWNFPAGDDVQACSGCHNPHRAKRDPHTTIGRTDGSGNLIVSAVSRPSRHSKDNNVWDLWGDESGERMRDYAGAIPYQAPYRYSSTTTYEPDGSNITNGSNLFDTVTFCLDCHSQSVGGRYAINWGTTGNVHGLAPSQNCCNLGDKKAPYPADPAAPTPYPNYVLSCLDCHEPHGSPNPMLLRQEVNGINVGTFSGTQYWNFCSACHTIYTGVISGYHSGLTSSSSCVCHTHYLGSSMGCWPASNCNSFGLPGCATAVCDGFVGLVPSL
jgi:predicted CXXCH cytochrome family protein